MQEPQKERKVYWLRVKTPFRLCDSPSLAPSSLAYFVTPFHFGLTRVVTGDVSWIFLIFILTLSIVFLIDCVIIRYWINLRSTNLFLSITHKFLYLVGHCHLLWINASCPLCRLLSVNTLRSFSFLSLCQLIAWFATICFVDLILISTWLHILARLLLTKHKSFSQK